MYAKQLAETLSYLGMHVLLLENSSPCISELPATPPESQQHQQKAGKSSESRPPSPAPTSASWLASSQSMTSCTFFSIFSLSPASSLLATFSSRMVLRML
eukprot:GHUV01044876.1.p2 GENE.GHUV01044876.1~~GHUV01044876.1.p2  ORF type:complete len:100 (+),score=17.63 GHUV01044876.1:1064-1363(+)